MSSSKTEVNTQSQISETLQRTERTLQRIERLAQVAVLLLFVLVVCQAVPFISQISPPVQSEPETVIIPPEITQPSEPPKSLCPVRIVDSQLGKAAPGVLDWIKAQLNKDSASFRFDSNASTVILVRQMNRRINTELTAAEIQRIVEQGMFQSINNRLGAQKIILVPIRPQLENWEDIVDLKGCTQLDRRAYSLLKDWDGIVNNTNNFNKIDSLKHRLNELCEQNGEPNK